MTTSTSQPDIRSVQVYKRELLVAAMIAARSHREHKRRIGGSPALNVSLEAHA